MVRWLACCHSLVSGKQINETREGVTLGGLKDSSFALPIWNTHPRNAGHILTQHRWASLAHANSFLALCLGLEICTFDLTALYGNISSSISCFWRDRLSQNWGGVGSWGDNLEIKGEGRLEMRWDQSLSTSGSENLEMRAHPMITRVQYSRRSHVAHLLGGVLMWHRPMGVSWITQHAVSPGREEPLGRASSLWVCGQSKACGLPRKAAEGRTRWRWPRRFGMRFKATVTNKSSGWFSCLLSSLLNRGSSWSRKWYFFPQRGRHPTNIEEQGRDASL